MRCVFLLCLAVSLSTATANASVALRFQLNGVEGKPLYGRPRLIPLAFKPTALLQKVPVLKSKSPLYAQFQLGEMHFNVIFDGTGPDYDTLYVDNGHGEFAANQLYSATPKNHGAIFTQVLFNLLDFKGILPYRAVIVVRANPPGASAVGNTGYHAYIRCQGAWVGTVNMGGHAVNMDFLDADSNGHFGDIGNETDDSFTGDLVHAQLGSGVYHSRSDYVGADYTDLQLYGSCFTLYGRFYRTDIERNGNGIAANVVTLPTGVILCNYSEFTCDLVANGNSVLIHGAQGRARAPVGNYTLGHWFINATDTSGKRWWASALEPEPPRTLAVRAAGATHLSLPVGFRVSFVISYYPGRIEFRPEIYSADGREIMIQADGFKAAAPQIRVTDTRDNPISRSGLGDGPDLPSLEWSIIAGVPDRLKAYPLLDTGPFRVRQNAVEFSVREPPHE